MARGTQGPSHVQAGTLHRIFPRPWENRDGLAVLNVPHKHEPRASTGISQEARSFQAPVSADYLGVLANRGVSVETAAGLGMGCRGKNWQVLVSLWSSPISYQLPTPHEMPLQLPTLRGAHSDPHSSHPDLLSSATKKAGVAFWDGNSTGHSRPMAAPFPACQAPFASLRSIQKKLSPFTLLRYHPGQPATYFTTTTIASLTSALTSERDACGCFQLPST